MQFDIFHEIAQPPQLARSEAQAYADTLAEIEYADLLGFGCAWLVEHHFMRGYSHCSKPELVLAAAAQRTRRVRLGFAVMPLPLHHPVHLAERVATLDILAQGRLEVGIGRGFSPQEFAVFGRPMADSRELAEEALDILRLSLSGRPVSYQGKHYRLAQCDIVPRVQQAPPLWSAAVSPQTYTWAAQQGLGILAGPFKPWFMVKRDIEQYRAAWKQPSPPRIGMTVGVLCLENGARARALAATAFTWFYRELYRTTLPVLEQLYPSYEHFHELGKFRKLLKLGINLPMLEFAGLAVVGNAAECIDQLRKYQESGVTHLLCAVGAGALPSETVRESMRCLAEHVLPAFSA